MNAEYLRGIRSFRPDSFRRPKRRSAATTAIVALLGVSAASGFAPARAETTDASVIQTLKQQVQQLQSEIDQIEAREAAKASPAPSAAAAAQPASMPSQAAPSGKPEKLSDLALGKVKLSALFFGDYAYYSKTGFGPQFLTQLNQDGPGNNGFNSFDVTRTYLNFFYTPTDAVTLRVTPNIYRQVDVSGATGNGKNSGIASSSNGNLGFRLKYAYVEFNSPFKGSAAFGKDKVTLGQTTNPLVDWEEGLTGRRYIYLTPWNYLSLSSTYSGATVHGPVMIGGREYLDYHVGIFNTASFHALEVSEKKQAMARVTWYPFGTDSDRTGFGVTAFGDYGYVTKTPDSPSTSLDRWAFLLHYQTLDKRYLIAAEYDLGRNAFSVGNLFSGAGPADALGLASTPTPYANFSSMASAILGGTNTHQEGFDVFGHAQIGSSPFYLFGFFQQFKPNTHVLGANPLDFQRTVAGVSYHFNDHLDFALDDQNLTFTHRNTGMSAAALAPLSGSLAAANPNGIANVLTDTNVIFLNLQYSY